VVDATSVAWQVIRTITWWLMQLRLLSTAHGYKSRTSITVNTGENRWVTITTDNHNHLTIQTAGLSGEIDDRECERWKESHQMILLWQRRRKCSQTWLVYNCELLKWIRNDLWRCIFVIYGYFWIWFGYDCLTVLLSALKYYLTTKRGLLSFT
jgi:hypothetical protein